MSRPIRTCILRIPLRCRMWAQSAPLQPPQRSANRLLPSPRRKGLQDKAARRAIVNTIHD
jgi:hypothetical protein